MLNTFTIYYWFSLCRGLCFGWLFWWGSAPPAHIDEPRLDVHLSFPCLFPVSLDMCPFWIIVVRHVWKKINNQLWDYSVIYGIFLNFLPSVTGNEITGWYVLIFLHTLLVRPRAQNSRCLCGSLVTQDRFQNKSLRHFCPVHCLSLIFREWIQNHSRNFAACTCPKNESIIQILNGL